MKLSYQEVTDKRIDEVKDYLYQIASKNYQFLDAIEYTMDIKEIKRIINKNKGYQVYLFMVIKNQIDHVQTYEDFENHLIMLNLLFGLDFKTLNKYKYNLFTYILDKFPRNLDTYCLLRHLIDFKNFLLFVENLYVGNQNYHYLMSEVLLLERKYKEAFEHVKYVGLDNELSRYKHVLYNYSPRNYHKLYTCKIPAFNLAYK